MWALKLILSQIKWLLTLKNSNLKWNTGANLVSALSDFFFFPLGRKVVEEAKLSNRLSLNPPQNRSSTEEDKRKKKTGREKSSKHWFSFI